MSDQDPLRDLRAELDLLDESLLDILRRRIDCGVRIAEHKVRYGLPMMQPGRIQLVKQRATRYAEAHGLDADFLVALYDVIIAEMCRVEDLVMGAGDRR